jgi:uncharacterized protein (DUF849 family)
MMQAEDLAGTTLGDPATYEAYREMIVPAGPGWAEEHVKRLSANGVQSHFQLAHVAQLDTLERMFRRGKYFGPLNLTWVGIGGGFDAPNPHTLMNFIRQVPEGATLTLESSMRNVLPINTMAIAMGLHVRCGNEDNLWKQDRSGKISSVEQVEQLVRISRELGRKIATGQEARRIYRIGQFYQSTEETLARAGYAPNRERGQKGFLHHA